MRTTAYIMLGISGIAILFCLSLWAIGLVAGQTFGGLLHLLLALAMMAIPLFVIGSILLIISFAKQPK